VELSLLLNLRETNKVKPTTGKIYKGFYITFNKGKFLGKHGILYLNPQIP